VDHEAIVQVFLAQSEEGLTAAEERLVALESRPDDAEALGEVFRVIHTLKGDAGSLGFAAMADFTHGVEDLLDGLREGRQAVTSERVTLLLEAVDALRELLADAAVGLDETRPAHRELRRRLHEDERASGAGGGGGDVSLAEAASVHDAPKTAPAPSAGAQAKTLRVDVDKLDQLLTLTGEVAVARGRLTQALEDPERTSDKVLEIHREADRLYLDLQELVMALRMVPIGPPFRQFGRVVRDLARSHGKQARFFAEGGEVEVDNSVLQLLKDPLTHMIRNALDHGIEPPEGREALGKELCGEITLRAAHEAGSIVIELSDDGAGLDRERILEQAQARGLVREGQTLNEAEIDPLIFEAGFSTAERVTDLSGRGVGMDVVRRNIDALRGALSIESRPGAGTTFTIRLPLTLAIIEGLLVGLGSETYVVPLDAVVESVELPAEAARRSDGRGVISLRGKTLPIVRLRHLFGVAGEPPPRENVVVVAGVAGQAGFVVDALFGQSQTVIKPMAKLFQGVLGISASAILGNGRVALIVDVPGLLRSVLERATTGHGVDASRLPPSVSPEAQRPITEEGGGHP
jgi:two-component system chemotaxis sensor kinase CheA